MSKCSIYSILMYSLHCSIRSPLDIDLYTGALSEPPLKGAIFGPLLTCLVSDQFLRLKAGDSHWYERTRGTQRFTRGGFLTCFVNDNI